MAHASLEELHEAIGDLKAEWRSRDESRASALDMRRAMDQTAAVISRLRARAVAEPEAVAEELVDLFREDGTLLGAASGRAPRWAAVFGEPPIESESAGGGGRVSFEGPPPSREVIINVPALVARFDRGAHVTIASGTNTGKSYLARAIAREMVDTRRVHDVFVLSDDPETAEATYDPVLGDDLEDVGLFSEDELRAIFKRQEEARKEKTLRRTLVIVDDVSGVEKSATLEMMLAGASGTDGGIPPSWGYFQTTPPVYASNLSISTAGVTGVGWQDTMTTVISYDLGHLVVSNGDHYVSYGSN
jgi:hypothetical protein